MWRLVFLGAILTAPALAQDRSAYEVGLRLAQSRGYENTDCYARVFAKHAVVVEKANGRRGWYAASTPAYNADQSSRCGINRLERSAHREKPAGGAGSIPYRIGVSLAAQRGIYGPSASCFARVFEANASRQPSPDRKIRYGISGRDMDSFNREVQRRCGLLL